MSINYFNSDIKVLLGDRVSVRIWFKSEIGRIVYVPGISHINPEFEFNGMQWVCIRLLKDNMERGLLKTVVLTKTGNLQKSVKFIERDESSCKFISETSTEWQDQESGPIL